MRQADLTLSEFAIVSLMATQAESDVTYRQIYDAARGRDFAAPLLRQGHQRGPVRAKKHGTKSGSGAPLRRGLSVLDCRQNPSKSANWTNPAKNAKNTPKVMAKPKK